MTDLPNCDICGHSFYKHMEIVGMGRVCPASAFSYRRPREPDRATTETLEARIAKLEGALEPFAKFNTSGFDDPIVEVVPPWAENPASRIEIIDLSAFRNARTALQGTEEKSSPDLTPGNTSP